jgi:glycine cleavage system H lipoate-binding protein
LLAGLVNTSCYGAGWIFKIKLSNEEELKGLMDESSYESYLKTVAE